MTAFTIDVPIRFQHTDPAKIVFYPRFFEIVNQVVEDWFAEGLACGYDELHGRRALGIPTVRTEAEFPHPSRLGEVLAVGLEVEHLGRTSFTLRVEGTCKGEVRLSVRQTLVFASIDGLRPVPVPEDLRERMAAFVMDPAP